jgi:beta-lactamase class A
MTAFAAALVRWLRARPGALAAGGLVLVAAAAGGGWALATHPGAERIAYTRGPASPVAERPAPQAPQGLQADLEALVARYHEPVGIAVTDVTDGWTAQIAGEEVYPQQSVSKLWVALAVLQAVDDGRLSLDQWTVLRDEDRSVFYQPITARIRGPNGLAITISDLLRHALIESDNAANDKLIREVGGAGVITRAIADKGLTDIAVGGTERDLQTRTAGLAWQQDFGRTWIWKTAREKLPEDVRDAALAAYLADPPDGATPVGIARALAALKRGELLSQASTDFMLGLMGEARTGTSRLHGGLQRGWTLAHKTGTGPDWRGASVGINDVGLLTAPDGRTYAVAVMVRQTWRPASARHALFQGVTRAIAASWSANPSGSAESRQVAGARIDGAGAGGS